MTAPEAAATAPGRAATSSASQNHETPDALYRERAHLVAHLAAIYPSCIGPAPDVDETGWAVIYINSPEGQMSWHISPRDLDLFGHVFVGTADWDGHTTAEKYARLDKLTNLQNGSETTWDEDLRRERDSLTGQLDGLRDHIDSLARGLDMSASTTAPSKKSEIEAGCAAALRGLLRIDGESGEETRQRLDRERNTRAGLED